MLTVARPVGKHRQAAPLYALGVDPCHSRILYGIGYDDGVALVERTQHSLSRGKVIVILHTVDSVGEIYRIGGIGGVTVNTMSYSLLALLMVTALDLLYHSLDINRTLFKKPIFTTCFHGY